MTQEQDAAFSDERVLWTGRPTRYPVFDRIGVLLTAVGIYAIVGAVFSIVAGVRAGNSAAVILSGLIALLILVAVIGRPLLRRAALRRTQYRLTDSQIVVCSTATERREQVANLRDLASPILNQRDGANTGTIRFEGSPLVLLEIENPRQVLALITTAQADST